MKMFYVDPCFYYSLVQFSPVLKMKDQDENVLLIIASNQVTLQKQQGKKPKPLYQLKNIQLFRETFLEKVLVFFILHKKKSTLLNHVQCCKVKAHRYYFYDHSTLQIQSCRCENPMKKYCQNGLFFFLNKKLPLVY